MNPEPSRSELLHRIAELEARLAAFETEQTEPAIAREITERKRAEQASRESEERLRLFMENIPAAIAMFDRDMRYIAVSGRWAEHFGGAEHLLGKPHYEIFPDCPEHWRAGHRRGMAGEIVRVEEDLWQLPDGSDVWSRYEVRPWRTTDGEIGGIIIFTEDIRERKQAEEALRRSERIYRAIGESTDYGVWVCAPDGRQTYASDSFLKMVGRTQEQCSDFGWANVLHPDDADRTIAAWKECIRTQGKWDMELRFRGVDGDWHPVLSRGVPVRDGHGQIACWAGIKLDISALKRTEASLRASEAKASATAAELQTIMDTSTAVIVVAHDVEAHHVGGNRKANELLHQPLRSNLSSAAAVERPGNFRLVRDGVELPEDERPLAKVAASGQALRNYELHVVLEDGASIDLLGNVEPLLDDDGRPRGAVAVFGDITERKRAEAALRDRERLLDSIYNTVRDAIFYLAVEPEGRFRFASVNPTFLRVTGLSPDAVVGRTVNEVTPEPSLTMVLEKYRQAVERKAIVSWEETTEYAPGRFTGEVTVAPVFDNAGACTHLVGSVYDISERKRAESALRESEERFRTVADTAPVMIWMAGLDKHCTFVNKSWLKFSGRTMEQELQKDWAEGIHPEDRDRCLATYYSSFNDSRSFQMEYRLQRADGEYRWVLDNGTPLYREGEFAGYIGSCVDVTEQKRVEEQLRSNQVQLMDSQRLAKVASWEVDIATGRTRWSDEWYRIFGLPRDVQPEIETFLSRVHPKDREIVLNSENKVRLSDSPFSVDFRIIRPGGEVRFIRSIVEGIKNENGELVRMAGAAQDVTEQVKATELLRESEARLKSAERLTHVGNWVWDIKTKRVSWSEEIFRIVGQAEDYEPVYEDSLRMIAPGDRDRVEQWVRDCLAEKEGNLIEFRIIQPSGEMRTVVLTTEVMQDEDDSPERMFGTCQDVTDARRAQEESFSRQKLESLGTLASGIAHDFNNLLGAVLAQTELAVAELGPGSGADEELKAIRDVAIRGAEIVRQLMIYAGEESDVPGPVDASKALQGMVGLLKAVVSRHVALVTDLGENLPAVRARAAQLSQIVMNLAVNASDALGDRDGFIRVATRHIAIGEAEAIARALPAGDYVQLEISDTGRGMSPETQAKIFDPFFSTKFSGRGLGLAVVDGIVRSLHGAIQVASEAGKGTTFQVLLPCVELGARPDDDRILGVEESTLPARRATVLVVEDEEPLRLAVAKMLRKWGLEVVEAASGSTAIDLLRARGGEIDLMLLDLTIPGSSSQEVLAEAAREQPNVKVILTSAYSEEVAKPMMLATLVCGFIRKPFTIADHHHLLELSRASSHCH
jgi:two-component system, cell cycle sensor histidine kinase and response regulator CckA